MPYSWPKWGVTFADLAIYFGDGDVTRLRGAARSAYRRHTVGVVFQAFNLIPSLSARANVMVPLRLWGVPRPDAHRRAAALLEQVGLDQRAHHRPEQMSGGEQQRVAIARALVQEPPLVLADEPTAHLDYIQVEGILQLLRTLAARDGWLEWQPTTIASPSWPTG